MDSENGDYFEEEEQVSTDTLRSWSTHEVDEDAGEVYVEMEDTGERDEPIFDIRNDLNEKIFIFVGDISRIHCDAVVNSTNDSFIDRSEHSKLILNGGGRKLQEYLKTLGQTEKLAIGSPLVVKGFDLPAKSVINVICPVFNTRFVIASKNALHLAYRSAIQSAVDNKIYTVAFPVLHKDSRQYPKGLAAHIVCRTIRRTLEHLQNHDLKIILVFDSRNDTQKIYEWLLPLYFPRVEGDLKRQLTDITIDSGDGYGGVLVEERQISIESKFPEPLRKEHTTDGSNDIINIKEGVSFSQMEYQGGEALRVVHSPEYSRFESFVQKSAKLDYSSVKDKKIVYLSGYDKKNRPILAIDGSMIPETKEEQELLFLFVLKEFNATILQTDFVLLLLTEEMKKVNLNLIREIIDILPSNVKKNMKFFAIYPKKTAWIRMVSWYTTPMVSMKFWRKKYLVLRSREAVYDM